MTGTIIPAGEWPAATTEKKPKSMNPNGARKMELLKEALSRARMRQPQSGGKSAKSAEAPRSARMVAMQARRQAARELGLM
jgi:hypothetical protein